MKEGLRGVKGRSEGGIERSEREGRGGVKEREGEE